MEFPSQIDPKLSTITLSGDRNFNRVRAKMLLSDEARAASFACGMHDVASARPASKVAAFYGVRRVSQEKMTVAKCAWMFS
jgi:hypothetical protein